MKWLIRSRMLPGLGYSVHFTGARWEGGEADVDRRWQITGRSDAMLRGEISHPRVGGDEDRI